jgi:cytidylate kinase
LKLAPKIKQEGHILNISKDLPNTKMIKIAVSGLHGSGRSTHAKRLAETFNLRYLSSGMIFRQIAREQNLSLEKLSILAEQNPEFDKLIDERTKEESMKGSLVVDATLAGWMMENPDLKIYLTAPLEARIRRIAKREGISLKEAKSETIVREESERQRFMILYGVDINDLSIHDVILNTELFTPDSTARILKKIVNEYCTGR